jgi:hypothetical protein
MRHGHRTLGPGAVDPQHRPVAEFSGFTGERLADRDHVLGTSGQLGQKLLNRESLGGHDAQEFGEIGRGASGSGTVVDVVLNQRR